MKLQTSEIAFTHCFMPQRSAEVVLTCPQEQTVRSGGLGPGF
ncbi:MAG: hypothetical protein ABI781_10860 [Burkholderiales bacterium]